MFKTNHTRTYSGKRAKKVVVLFTRETRQTIQQQGENIGCPISNLF